MSDDVTTEVEITQDGARARVVATRNKHEVGELTLARSGAGSAWEANHTFVAPEARGEGVAGVMFEAMVGWLKARGERVIPTCSYVAKRFDQDGSPKELLAQAR